MFEVEMRIKTLMLAALNGLMSLPVVLTLLALAVVGAFASVWFPRLAVPSIALAAAAIGLTLASLTLGVNAAGYWLAGIHERLTQFHDDEMKALAKQTKPTPTPESAQNGKPN
jgi:hypothetical protein